MKPWFEKIPYTDGMSLACKAYAGRECSNPYHLHPEVELVHFTQGRGHWMVGDSLGELRPGFLALLGRDLPHSYRVEAPPATAHVLQFREDCFGEGFFRLPENRRLRRLLTHARRGLRFDGTARHALGERLARLVDTAPERRLGPFLDLLERAAAHKAVTRLAGLDYQPTLQPEEAARINRVVEYLGRHLDRPVYQDEVAELVGLSRAAFSRFFSRTVKKPFVRFLNEMRISRACHHLAETDRTVTEIAFACGYDNLSNFNRRFLDLRGETPTAFRLRMQRLVLAEACAEIPARFVTTPKKRG